MSKLLSAMPRLVVPFQFNAVVIPVGVFQDALPLWGPGAPAPRNVLLNIAFLHKFRFDASMAIAITSHADAISLESASLQFQTVGGTPLITQGGRLSSLTALAAGQSVQFDPITLDGVELSFAGRLLGDPQNLLVSIVFTTNNAAGAAGAANFSGSFTQQEFIYDSYDFPAPPQ